MMYRNRNRHLSGEPGMVVPTPWVCLEICTDAMGLELLHMLQQSLQSKVAMLEEDNWMFETEDDPLV